VFVEAIGIKVENVKEDETFVGYKFEGNLMGFLIPHANQWSFSSFISFV
jgi:hypothetical protein